MTHKQTAKSEKKIWELKNNNWLILNHQGAFGLRIDVWDDDGGNWLGIGGETDLADKYVTDIFIPAGRSSNQVELRSPRLQGRRSSMGLYVRLVGQSF